MENIVLEMNLLHKNVENHQIETLYLTGPLKPQYL